MLFRKYVVITGHHTCTCEGLVSYAIIGACFMVYIIAHSFAAASAMNITKTATHNTGTDRFMAVF